MLQDIIHGRTGMSATDRECCTNISTFRTTLRVMWLAQAVADA